MANFLSIVAVFKNEAHILKEWIDHYMNQGVDHFYLIDNGSTDDYKDTLQNFSSEFGNITCIIDATPHNQVQHYNKYSGRGRSRLE